MSLSRTVASAVNLCFDLGSIYQVAANAKKKEIDEAKDVSDKLLDCKSQASKFKRFLSLGFKMFQDVWWLAP